MSINRELVKQTVHLYNDHHVAVRQESICLVNTNMGQISERNNVKKVGCPMAYTEHSQVWTCACAQARLRRAQSGHLGAEVG